MGISHCVCVNMLTPVFSKRKHRSTRRGARQMYNIVRPSSMDFPVGHPSQHCCRVSTLYCEVPMSFGALAALKCLVQDRGMIYLYIALYFAFTKPCGTRDHPSKRLLRLSSGARPQPGYGASQRGCVRRNLGTKHFEAR